MAWSKSTFDEDRRNDAYCFSAFCPDQECQSKLFFLWNVSYVECNRCGQRHSRSSLKGTETVADAAGFFKVLTALASEPRPKKGTEYVKVLGLSNYRCKLLSPILTKYTIVEPSGDVKPLSTSFDCSRLAEKAFRIEPEHKDIHGYGRDTTGSAIYLRKMLSELDGFNKCKDALVPIHADGDGHCLVHSISRALVGRELFWHALRDNLKEHFERNLALYKEQFRDFMEETWWAEVVAECDPEYIPRNNEMMGLTNMHIFGLANVLHRPIVLLDSLSGIQCSGDYTGVFLPSFVEPSKCRGKDGTLNKPICIAWSSGGRNHYIALVGTKGNPLPRIPSLMIPKVWGVPQELFRSYVNFNPDGSITIGGDKSLSDNYIQRIVNKMDSVFLSLYQVSTSLLADVHQFIFKHIGFFGLRTDDLIVHTVRRLAEKKLLRCLNCDAVTECQYDTNILCRNGYLYNMVLAKFGQFNPGDKYTYPVDDEIKLTCSYDADQDCLVPEAVDYKRSCLFCLHPTHRMVRNDGSTVYENGDHTKTRSAAGSQCAYKHYCEGKEYDNPPKLIQPIMMTWKGQTVIESIFFYHGDSDPSLNSNAISIAEDLVQKHFPDEFGTTQLKARVSNDILEMTRSVAADYHNDSILSSPKMKNEDAINDSETWRPDAALKTIMTGYGKDTVHKEEMTKSETEKAIVRRTQENAALKQRLKSEEKLRRERSLRDVKKDKCSVGNVKIEQEGLTVGDVVMKDCSSIALEQKSNDSNEPMVIESGSFSTPANSIPANATNGPIPDSTTIKRTSPSVVQDNLRIRVTTSDGRQCLLTLPLGVTYYVLEMMLCSKFSLPTLTGCKIKYGFPPREITPPTAAVREQALPLKNGDKVTVELPQKAEEVLGGCFYPFPPPPPPQNGDILERMTNNEPGDPIVLQQILFDLMVKSYGVDPWGYCMINPTVFAEGGLFYEQLFRHYQPISDGKHVIFSSLPGKVFRFNAKRDLLELCLGPNRHVEVERNIDRLPSNHSRTALDTSPSVSSALATDSDGLRSTLKDLLQTASGRSEGIENNNGEKFPQHKKAPPFSGHGHRLAQVPNGNNGNGSKRKLRDAANASAASVQPQASPVGPSASLEDAQSCAPTPPVYKRLGPGYTVLVPASSSSTGEKSNGPVPMPLDDGAASKGRDPDANDGLVENHATTSGSDDVMACSACPSNEDNKSHDSS